jgi:hypothetical protein
VTGTERGKKNRELTIFDEMLSREQVSILELTSRRLRRCGVKIGRSPNHLQSC